MIGECWYATIGRSLTTLNVPPSRSTETPPGSPGMFITYSNVPPGGIACAETTSCSLPLILK
jgi:hypothetical protein